MHGLLRSVSWTLLLLAAGMAAADSSAASLDGDSVSSAVQGDRRRHHRQRSAFGGLRPCPIPDTEERMLCGTYEVFEDRVARRGRHIVLEIAVLPALSADPRPDPIFYLAGGPGASARARAAAYRTSWMREDRDLVLVDQRGTGGSNLLQCRLRGGPDDIQGYTLTGFDQPEELRACRAELETRANPGLYTTPLAMTYPLHHAADSQRSLDLIFEECAADPACSSAFPNLAQEFDGILATLDQGPVTVAVQHPDTGQPAEIQLTRSAFAEWLRWMISSRWGTRWTPYLLHLAHQGNFDWIAQDLVETVQFYNQRLAMGQLMSVVCPADVSRIDVEDIPRLTANTFMGDERVWQVIDVCADWTPAEMPAGFGDPVVSDAPTLLWSGTLDPRNPPYWGDEAARHLSNSLHLVVPDAHGVSGPCIDSISRDFLNAASPLDVDTSCTESIELPPFGIPE